MRDATIEARFRTLNRALDRLTVLVGDQQQTIEDQQRQIGELQLRLLFTMRRIALTVESKLRLPNGQPVSAETGHLEHWFDRDREKFVAILEREAAEAAKDAAALEDACVTPETEAEADTEAGENREDSEDSQPDSGTDASAGQSSIAQRISRLLH